MPEATCQHAQPCCNKRLFGIHEFVLGHPRDVQMRVPDELLKSVLFLCKKCQSRDRGYEFLATGFLFSVAIKGRQGLQCVYLVTARHVIQAASYGGYDLYARINNKNGSAQLVRLRANWVFSENDGVDVAVCASPFGDQGERLDCHPIRSDVILNDFARQVYRIGIGDSIFAIGLFAEHKGTQRNVPIVKMGNIAAVPSEPLIDSKSGQQYHAYLADMVSTAGLSGAPVFAFLEPSFPQDVIQIHDTPVGIHGRITGRAGRIYLLGIIRGHWELNSQNMGVAIVTPADALTTLISGNETFRELEKRIVADELRKHAPVPDNLA